MKSKGGFLIPSMRRFTSLYLIILACLSVSSIACEEHSAYSVTTRIDERLMPYTASPEMLPVIICLNEQPQFQISEEMRALHEPEMRAVTRQMRDVQAKYRRVSTTGRRDEERALGYEEIAAMSLADRLELNRLKQESRRIKGRANRAINFHSEVAIAPSQNALAGAVEALGGQVIYRYTITNSVAARIPGTAVEAVAELPFVAFVLADEEHEAELNISVPSMQTPTFWNAGFTGGDAISATLDSGVTANHPALSSKIWISQVFHASAVSSTSYADDPYRTDDLSSHGTHVAGIMNSSDSTYRGVGWGSTRSMNLKAAYLTTSGSSSMNTSDCRAAVDWALKHNYFPDVINYSFGGSNPLEDDAQTRFWDAAINRGFGTVATKSAGNSGPEEGTVTGPLAYNFITVANANDRGTLSRGDDILSSTSSRGPTPAGRKKPDIAAPGTTIMSTSNNWDGGSNFVNKSGTSMAAPHVGGAATLLSQAGVSDPRAAKAILLNSAEGRGVAGWDVGWGWGYVDLDHAFYHRNDYFTDSITPAGRPGSVRLYRSTGMTSGDTATLVWHRRAVYNNNSVPTTWYALSNLDLRLYREAYGELISQSNSTIDNVEQVATNQSDPQIIKVYTQSTSFAGAASETYALATENSTVAITGPSLSCRAEFDTYTPPVGAAFVVRARVRNDGGAYAHNCHLTIYIPPGVSLLSGDVTQSLSRAFSDGGYSNYAEWHLKADAPGTHTVYLWAVSDSYGESWTGYDPFLITADGHATSTIADVKNLSDGSNVTLVGKVVSAVFPGIYYIQEPDRSSGIRVAWSGTPGGEGDLVTVMGHMGLDSGEREIQAISVVGSSGPGSPRPLGMIQKNLAGKPSSVHEPEVPGAVGLNNVGLLVRSWGTVTRKTDDFFIMDDGSGIHQETPTPGITVLIGSTEVKEGDYVIVTGISGVMMLDSPVRVLRPRRAEDIVIRAETTEMLRNR